jgi:hypothetical protein
VTVRIDDRRREPARTPPRRPRPEGELVVIDIQGHGPARLPPVRQGDTEAARERLEGVDDVTVDESLQAPDGAGERGAARSRDGPVAECGHRRPHLAAERDPDHLDLEVAREHLREQVGARCSVRSQVRAEERDFHTEP